MKKMLLFLLFIGMGSYIFADQIEFIYSLGNQKVVTYGELLKMFCYIEGGDSSGDFKENKEFLSNHIKHFPGNKNEKSVATTGDFALLAIQYLGLKGGLLYTLTKSGRYALRELIYRRVFDGNISEQEKLSGDKMLTYIQKVESYAEKK